MSAIKAAHPIVPMAEADGFYIGSALQHYRSYQVLIPNTGATCITDTVEWHLHHLLVLPVSSPSDLLYSSIEASAKKLQRVVAPTTVWLASAWQQRVLVADQVPITLVQNLELLHAALGCPSK
jgi:hypothetical protein